MNLVRHLLARLKSLQGVAWQPVLPPPQALFELAVLVAAIALADWALPGLDIAALEPSPYWVPVLLLSLQYGTIAGLLAAGAATIAHVLYGFPEQSIGENLFAYLLRIWALPMLWIGVALVLGQFRLRQIEVKQDLRRNLAQRTAEAQSLAGYAHDLEARCQRLERNISAGAGSSSAAALDALVALMRAPVDLNAALAGVSQTVLPGAALSVFSATPAGSTLVASSGWPEAPAWATDFGPAHPLYRAVAAERRSVCVLNMGDEVILSGQGLAACPIFAADSGRVIGIVKLETAGPSLLSRTTPEHLAVIARLVAPALAELRIVVDNSPRESWFEQAQPVRLMQGWRQQAWRTPSGTGERADGTAPDEPRERSSRPKRLS